MPKRILLVEDQQDTSTLLTMALEMNGHYVKQADSVASAIKAGEEEDFDILLCDLGLPDGSGLEVSRSLSGKGNMKAVALTGYGMDEDIQKCKEAGFAVHLKKPVDIDVLQHLVEGLSSESPA